MALAGVVGCRHSAVISDYRPPNVPWAGFGQPGPAKIRVFINGNVQYPGLYHLDDGVALDGIESAVGGWAPCATCGGTPRRVRLVRDSSQATTNANYRFTQMTTEQLKAVRLRDSDRLSYWTAHW